MRQRILGIQKIYREGTRLLAGEGIEDAAVDAWYLLEFVTGVTRAAFYAHPDMELDADMEERYFACIGQRRQRIPLQHITGEQEFMGYPFCVNEHVLIPRQDTETLVEEALTVIRPGMRILDMCTGSGCILISILKAGWERQHVSGLKGVGSDISPEAAETAKKNAGRLLAEADSPPVTFCCGDLFEKVKGRYGLIVSNPPYIRTEVINALQEEVRCHDPYIALDGHEDGLYFYRRIAKESTAFIEDGGFLILETGYDQAEDVSALLRDAGYGDIFVKKDLTGLDRVVGGRYNREYTD